MVPEVLSRNGHTLCSRHPQREAEKWVERYTDLIRLGCPVVVLGMGAGFHVAELFRRFPKTDVQVVEFDEEIVQKFTSPWLLHLDGPEESEHILSSFEKLPLVLPFRPAWRGYERPYSKVLEILTLRHRGALISHDPRFTGCRLDAELLSANHYKELAGHLGDRHLYHTLCILGELIK